MNKKNKILYSYTDETAFIIKSKKYGDHVVYVDTEDIDKIKKHHWYVMPHRDKTNKYYVWSNPKRKTIYIHRLIMNIYEANLEIDHINNNSLDNRKHNLRICSRKQNGKNQTISSKNTSGYKGVCFIKASKRWQSYIGVNNRRIHLGFFDNNIDAARAYNRAALKYHGEFARLNNIDSLSTCGSTT